MTREYARRLHEGWSREFLMEAFGLTEDEHLEMFGECGEKAKTENQKREGGIIRDVADETAYNP